MAVIYQLYQDNREKSLTRGKWYARAKVQQTFDLDKLVEHMSNHDCPFSPGTIHGVLKDAIRCIRELTLDGNQVKLDELAMFSIGIETKPANSAKEFMASKNIVGARVNFLPYYTVDGASGKHNTRFLSNVSVKNVKDLLPKPEESEPNP
jgi:predicted histone-like DNA-binding protein